VLHRRHAHGAAGQDKVRRQRDQFRHVCALAVDISLAPANIDSRVAADRPSRFLQPLQERRQARLPVWIVRSAIDEYADAPRPVRLLRARRERPCRRAAERGYQLPPSHVHWHGAPPREGCLVRGTIPRREQAVFTLGRAFSIS
jgi:hypothetical protein